MLPLRPLVAWLPILVMLMLILMLMLLLKVVSNFQVELARANAELAEKGHRSAEYQVRTGRDGSAHVQHVVAVWSSR